MPYKWTLKVGRGAAALERRWEADPERPWLQPIGHWRAQAGREAARAMREGEPGPGRGDRGQSRRSRNNARRQLSSLPLEMLGDRLVFLSLTYPGEWRRWVPDGREWEKHRIALGKRWQREWGALVGVWVKEFQRSGRPHLHVYTGVPSRVSEADYEGLRRRTLLRQRLERAYGQYEGRRRMPAIGGEYGGDFGMWLRTTWAEVVGTQGVVKAHHARGVDVSVAFWSDEVAREKDRVDVASYLAGEAAKWRQKRPPEGFVGVGQYYGWWGRQLGFEPVEEEVQLDEAVAAALERRMVRWVRLRMLGRGGGVGNFDERRWGAGVQAFGLRPEGVARLLRWSEAEVARGRRSEARPTG